MKKLLLIAVIISATAFGAEAAKNTTPVPVATDVAATCPMTGGAPMGTGKMMNQGNGTGKMSCNMMQGGKMGGMKGGMMGHMMNSLSEKDQATVTKNRTEIHTEVMKETPDWKKVQKLHDENALIMSKGKVEMMKKNHSNMRNGSMDMDGMMHDMPNMNNGTVDHTNMNHQNMPVTPVKQN